MEVTFDEMPFVNDSVIHLQFAKTMVPSFFVLSFIFIVEPGRHINNKLYSSELTNLLQFYGRIDESKKYLLKGSILFDNSNFLEEN